MRSAWPMDSQKANPCYAVFKSILYLPIVLSSCVLSEDKLICVLFIDNKSSLYNSV